MNIQQSQFHATVPAMDMDRARRFYEEKLGLTPESVYNVGVIYRCADGTALFLYPPAPPEPAIRWARGSSTT
jgi:catechol 2,3-dioxygenase-like lactoylglutathione lyase family enzyme